MSRIPIAFIDDDAVFGCNATGADYISCLSDREVVIYSTKSIVFVYKLDLSAQNTSIVLIDFTMAFPEQ
jgi:hypothetical protein